MLKSIEKFTKTYLTLIILELAKFIKLSFAVASNGVYFSLTQVFTPLIGLYKNVSLTIALFAIRTFIRIFIIGFSPLILFYHLPTFCGNAYLLAESKYLKIAIPLICIFMFIIHPIGSQSFWYSSYWLIPISIALFKSKSIFLQALGSTFTTHAVGSVVWLYTKQISPSTWNTIFPIVPVERLLIATAITLSYYTLNHALKKLENFRLRKVESAESLKTN